MQRATDVTHAVGHSPRHRLQALIRTELAKHNPLEHSRGPLEVIAETSVRLADDGSGEYEVVDGQGNLRTAARDGKLAKMTVAELVAEFRAKHPTLFKPSEQPARPAALEPAAPEPAPPQKRRRGKRHGESTAAASPGSIESDVAAPIAALRHDPIALPPAPVRSAPAAPLRQPRRPDAVDGNSASKLAGVVHYSATRPEDTRAPLLERLSGLGTIAQSRRVKSAAAACLLIGAGFGGAFAFRSLTEPRGEGRALSTQAQRPLSTP